jgi:hypothetical protein
MTRIWILTLATDSYPYSDHPREPALWIALAVAAYAVSIALGAWYVRVVHRQLQRELPALELESPAPTDKLAERLGASGLSRKLRDGIAEARYELAGTPAGRAVATVDDAVLELAAGVVRRAVKSADAASVIVRRADDAVYAVALPVRHPRPQIVERYLGSAWPEHVASVQRAAAMPVLALVLLCPPDAHEASLLVGFAPAHGEPLPASDPEALLDASAARERAANQFRYVMTLSTPTHEA